MKTTKKFEKPCEKCGGKNIKTHLTTYPLKLDNKQINIERVSVKECMDCHKLNPTKVGQKKIERCMMTMAFMTLFDDE